MGLGDGRAGAGGMGKAGLSHLQRFTVSRTLSFFDTFISTITLGGRKQSLPREGQRWLPELRGAGAQHAA